MVRAATDRLKVNPAVGQKPALRWLRLDEMFVDHSYQRSLAEPQSQTLIRQIAVFWNWELCQPLTIAKRPNGALMIVDGQHRHAAAKLRGDIETLPCIVSTYATAGDEAAAFVALNKNRRALTALDLFKAALAANDAEAKAVLSAIEDAGLRLASSTNLFTLKAGAVSNIGGLLRCYRNCGEPTLRTALATLASSYPGEVLQYAGTIFPGLSAVAIDELRLRTAPADIIAPLARLVNEKSQTEWRKIIKAAVGESGGMAREASEMVFRRAWRAHKGIVETAPQRVEQRTARAIAEKRPRTFEEQLEAVRNGARVVDKVSIRPAFPDRTLGGVSPEAI
jgi:hypothetical protein